MIYLITFGISCGLFVLSESKYLKKKKCLKVIFAVLAITVPSLLAGLRDSSVGTDVEVYGNFWFEYTQRMKFLRYIEFAKSCSIGVVYALLNYIVGLFTDDTKIYYFVLSFVETGLIYIGVKMFNGLDRKSLFNNKLVLNDNNKISLPFAMFCYYTIFYNNTLNLLRQFLAVCFVFVAYMFIMKKKYVVSVLILMVAFLSHNSALFSFLLIPIFIISNEKLKSREKVYIFNIILFCSISLVMILYKPVLMLFISKGILSSRFLTYMEGTVVGGRMIRTVFWVILAVLGYIAFPKMINYQKESKFIISCITTSFAFSFVMFMGNVYAIRMAFYFDLASLIFIPMIPKIYKLDYKGIRLKYGMYVFLIIVLIARWYLEYVRSNNGQTFPYKFIQF